MTDGGDGAGTGATAGRAGIDYHQSLAAGWTARYEAGGFRRRRDFIAERVLPASAAAEAWIDVGCGSGVFSRLLADRGARVTGVDGSEAMIAAARKAPVAAGSPPPAFHCVPLDALAGLAGPFDGAVCFSVLEYLPDPAATVAGLADLIAPGGRLAVSVPNRLGPVRFVQRAARPLGRRLGGDPFAYLATSRHDFTTRGLRRLLAGHGFEVERVLGFDPLLPESLWPLVPTSLLFALAHRR